MKPVPQDIEDVFLAVKALVHDRITNDYLAQPLNPNTVQKKSFEVAKHEMLRKNDVVHNPKIYLAQFWLVLTGLLITELNEDHDLDNPDTFFRPLTHAAVLILLIFFYEENIGSIPLQQTVGKLILPKKDYEYWQRDIRYKYARLEATRKGPMSGWSLIFYNQKLEEIIDQRKIIFNIHDSILLALSSLKYESFGCVAITALTLLKLIERKVPYTLNWYYKPGNSADGHNFIIASDDEQNSFITDPWYGVRGDAKQRDDDPNFLINYPLLSADDKSILATIKPDDFKHYQGYIDLLNDALISYDKYSFTL